MGHALAENRHGLILAVAVTEATGTAEREAALAMVDEVLATGHLRPSTLGADKGYDDGQFLLDLEAGGSSRTYRWSRSRKTPRGCGISGAGPGSRPGVGCGRGRAAMGIG